MGKLPLSLRSAAKRSVSFNATHSRASSLDSGRSRNCDSKTVSFARAPRSSRCHPSTPLRCASGELRGASALSLQWGMDSQVLRMKCKCKFCGKDFSAYGIGAAVRSGVHGSICSFQKSTLVEACCCERRGGCRGWSLPILVVITASSLPSCSRAARQVPVASGRWCFRPGPSRQGRCAGRRARRQVRIAELVHRCRRCCDWCELARETVAAVEGDGLAQGRDS